MGESGVVPRYGRKPMSIVYKSILVHSCRIMPDGRTRDLLISGERYISELGVPLAQQEWYYPLPDKCKCRLHISVAEATEYVGRAWAVWILKFRRKKGELILNDGAITELWMPVNRERVPRVDLISRADIERATIGSERSSDHYRWNAVAKKFEVIDEVPEGMTKKEWIEDAKKEIKFEKRIRKQYSAYINECHEVAMNARAALMVPFRPDPFEGRTIFSFGVDQRTPGSFESIKDLTLEME